MNIQQNSTAYPVKETPQDMNIQQTLQKTSLRQFKTSTTAVKSCITRTLTNACRCFKELAGVLQFTDN